MNPQITEEEVRLWEAHLALALTTALEKLGVPPQAVQVERSTLVDVVARFLKDKKRLQYFHGIDELSRENRAGYISYWFARLHPIQLLAEGHSGLNDVVAAIIGFATVDIVSPKPLYPVLKELVYGLRYRTLTAPALVMIFRLLQERASGD